MFQRIRCTPIRDDGGEQAPEPDAVRHVETAARRALAARDTVWLHKLGKPSWFTAIPMVPVFAVTVVSLVLLGLALVGFAMRAWKSRTPSRSVPAWHA